MTFEETMLVIIFFEIFVVFLFVLRSNEILIDIEKDRQIAKEKQELKHLYDIKILKEMPEKFKAKEVKK